MGKLDELAKIHTSIWYQDDMRKYNQLERSVDKLLKLRRQKKDVKSVQELIRNSYETYGKLDDNLSDLSSEEVFDDVIYNNFIKIYTKTNEKNPISQAEYHSKWWKNLS